ncbi:MAG: ABC transporter ATP-binding protein [Phycisphaerales bacterium]
MTLCVRDLTLAFDSRPVLRGLSANFAPGTFTVVLGPNGVGKTTLLRAMIGARPPTSGTVELDGKPLAAYSGSQRAARLAYVPQRTTIEFGFTTAEVVALGRYARGPRNHDPVMSALAAVGLESHGARPFRELSIGQQQRATLARALAQIDLPGGDPRGKVLLADEPVSSLDPAQALGVLTLLRSLADGGLCVVAVVHDLALALRYADGALVLDSEGGCGACAPIAEIISSRVLDRVYGVPLDAPGPEDLVLIPRRAPRASGPGG